MDSFQPCLASIASFLDSGRFPLGFSRDGHLASGAHDAGNLGAFAATAWLYGSELALSQQRATTLLLSYLSWIGC